MRGADRISELHDSILTHILSYLPTKEAVRTGILSKRWRNMWTSVPVLDIDFDTREDFDVHGERHDSFVNFIDNVLTSRPVQRVDRFRLVYQNGSTFDLYNLPLKRWIHYVSQQCPRVLSIFLQHTEWSIEMPYLIFTCLSLEEIELKFYHGLPEDLNLELVTLPHLRKLNLGHFHIEADFMNKLLLGCPILDELELYACWLDISQISGGNLKSLVINGCYHSTEIDVSVPSLQYLKVTVMSSQTAGYAFKNMSSLVKACICLLAMNEMLIFNSGAKIIEGLLDVTAFDIILCGLDAKDMLKQLFKNCPYFENLKFVHFESFDGCMTGCIDTVDHLVQHSPALKEVTVYDCQDDADGKIDLIEELRKLLGEYGILVERQQGSTCSLRELKELLDEHLFLVEHIGGAPGDGEEEGGDVWWEDEEGNEGEASSAEEEEEGEDEADEYVGGAMEEGEEMEDEDEDRDEEEEDGE